MKQSTIAVKPLEKQLFTVAETAVILTTSKSIIYKLINKGDLRTLKLGGHKIPDYEIERFKRWAFENEIDYSDILKEGE
ncbi:helix-turn-helix domain-containing protein [Marinilactibacillus psychrotolerans]|uniref:helix-turn-helix domain-containing protein n=1 Tax=Marinilactibacillus psychrotolerans TaxID=191770 RepID=UPI003888F08A